MAATLPLATAFAYYVQCTSVIAANRETSGENLEALFRAMLHRAFTGELTAKWREAHMKELIAEMEHQARLLRNQPEEFALG
jgi:type I restriction enzyme S subunit